MQRVAKTGRKKSGIQNRHRRPHDSADVYGFKQKRADQSDDAGGKKLNAGKADRVDVPCHFIDHKDMHRKCGGAKQFKQITRLNSSAFRSGKKKQSGGSGSRRYPHMHAIAPAEKQRAEYRHKDNIQRCDKTRLPCCCPADPGLLQDTRRNQNDAAQDPCTHQFSLVCLYIHMHRLA